MASAPAQSKPNYTIPLIIIGGLFFVFGFITWVNGTLIPFMKFVCELTSSEALLVASAFYISYCVMALPSSILLKKIGFKNGMSLGLIVMAIGCLVFIPAAESRNYYTFLSGIFLQGIGLTLLQTASNPYITILGPIESAAKRISIMGIANKIAGVLGTIILGHVLLNGMDEAKASLATMSEADKIAKLNEMAGSVVTPYIIIAIVLVLVGILIRFSPLPEIDAPEEEADATEQTSKTNIFQFPHLWLGVFALFLYVGAEVIAGDTIIAYGGSIGIAMKEAKFFTSFTLYAMIGTYLLGVALIPKYLSQENALKYSAVLGLILTVAIVSTSGYTSVFCIAALGIANALMWPAIWPLAMKGLGKFTKTGSAYLVMAIAGGAVLPPLYGKIEESIKASKIASGFNVADATAYASNKAYWILLPCYAFILYFAMAGHKVGQKK